MKKSLLSLLTIFLIILTASYSVVKIFGSKNYHNESKKNHTIVSSFYPEYIILLNLLEDCDDINIKNMTSSATGCLHDYQLTSADMKVLDHADGFVINGGGMEPFLDDIKKSYKDLKIIDSSENIELLENISIHEHTQDNHNEDKHDNKDSNEKHVHTKDCEHNTHDEVNKKEPNQHVHTESCEHNHGEYNAHIWLNPDNYLIQIKNICTNLCTLYPEHKNVIIKNSKTYTDKIRKLQNEITSLNKKISKQDKKDIIIFHDSFAYIADSFNLNVVQCIEISSETSLSAGTIANTIDEINYHNIEILLSEKQFKNTIANNISKETNAKVYVLDSLVTGDNNKDSYIDGMKKNIESIQTIFK